MELISKIKEQAKKYSMRIVLPEGYEERTLQAADIATREKLAKIILIGDREKLAKIILIGEKARIMELAEKNHLKHISSETHSGNGDH